MYTTKIYNINIYVFQVRELQSQLEVRDDKIRELKITLDKTRESEIEQAATVTSLRQRLVEYEGKYGSLEGAANLSELAVKSLHINNQDANARIVELENRVK